MTRLIAIAAAAALFAAGSAGAQTIGIGSTKGSVVAAMTTAISKIVNNKTDLKMRRQVMGGTQKYIPVVDAGELDQDAVIDALWKKTGALYEFAGRAGAAIALNDSSADQPEAKAIASFCKLCGTAFQIQDDILGVVGDAEQLGKPVGSDIREGKTTLLTLHALARASQSQRDTLLGALGDEAASADDVDAVIQLLRETGAVSHAQVIARRYVEQALRELEALPDNRYRWLLSQWAHYLISRQF